MTEHKGDPPARDPDEPFADQIEWLANRYNPGHFLGGTLRPELRVASLGWHAKRIAGALAFCSGAAILGASLLPSAAIGVLPDPWSLALGLLSLMAAVRIWRSAAAQRSSEGGGEAHEVRMLLRVAAIVVPGVAAVAAISIVALAGVAMLVAVSRGQAGLAAAICVVIAIVAIRRTGRRPATG